VPDIISWQQTKQLSRYTGRRASTRARRQAGKKTGKKAGRQAFQTSQTSMCTHHGSFKWNIDTPTIEKIYMTSIKKIAM
jgi:hypothetical protein